MHLHETLTYQADAVRVFDLLCDEAWRVDVCERTQAASHEVSATRDAGDRATVSVTRVLPAKLPDAVRKFVGETVTVTQVETWGPADADGNRKAKLDLQVKGQPATMKGTATLSAGEQTTLTVDAEVKVSIPFLGSKIEPEIAKVIVRGLRVEEQTAAEYLA